MAYDIRNVKNITDLISYFSQNLGWNIDIDDFDDIEDISYDFDAEDIGLKEESFAKISSLRQLQPLVDGQQWGIFCVEFDSKKFEVSALRKILSGLIPRRRNSVDHAVWRQQDLLFICNWGQDNNRTIGVAHFEDKENGLPQIKMISCAPALEDFTQIKVFEDRLAQLAWPKNTSNIEEWRQAWSSAFTTAYHQTIQDSSTLTIQLAAEAQNIRNCILDVLNVESQNGYVHLLFEKFRDTLIHDMTEQQFADMYAQTVVYGLFSARCMDPTQEDFSAEEAVECIPNTNPFLKNLMKECLGSQNSSRISFDELEIGNVVELLKHTKTDDIIADFNRQTGGGREDPVIHFYEEFLTAYDKMQKVQRGVYYTPQPVVNFIVRAVDSIIKDEYGLKDGLASTETKKIKVTRQSKRRVDGYYYKQVEDSIEVPAVQVLDPATGTGTFIRQTILQIYENFKERNKGLPTESLRKAWNAYVPEHLLPRINAFELMMAPYAVAHMKLAMVLRDTGYDFDSSHRLNVYLTNSLEEPGSSDGQLTLWSDPLATESIAANAVKKNTGINIVLGNPPYSGESANNGEWAQALIEPYKREPGGVVKLQERNSKWINDDYVKFIRFAQTMVAGSDQGIVAYINPHGFSDNPTFRGMRWNLLQSFDRIYILDLHGNSKKKEKAPDGSKDENVFDIQQGVCIFIAVRLKGAHRKSEVFHADIFGTRDEKYRILSKANLSDFDWVHVDYHEPYYLFKPREEGNIASYDRGFGVNDLFVQNSIGVVSARDDVVVDFTEEGVLKKIELFCNPGLTDQEVRDIYFPGKRVGNYLAGDTRGWSLSEARKTIRGNEHIKFIERFLYRPFDWRYIYYTKTMVDWSREQVMRNFIKHENVALIAPRQTKDHIGYYITEVVCGHKTCSAYDVNTIFPLFIYTERFGKEEKIPNFKSEIVTRIQNMLNISFVNERNENDYSVFSAWDLFDYIFAITNSEKYKREYAEFLKVEFPKIPYPSSQEYFWSLVKLGNKLRNNQLLHNLEIDPRFSLKSSDSITVIDRVKYDGKNVVKISKSSEFSGIPQDLWDSYVGGYKPLQKWLQDRKGRELTEEDKNHYLLVATALMRCKQIVEEIDQAIVIPS